MRLRHPVQVSVYVYESFLTCCGNHLDTIHKAGFLHKGFFTGLFFWAHGKRVKSYADKEGGVHSNYRCGSALVEGSVLY